MSPITHTVVSAAVSVAFYQKTQSVSGTVVCFLSGIFIDIDHFFDYWIAKKKVSLSYKGLKAYCAREKAGKLYLIFHSYELLALLWYFVLTMPQLPMVWLGLAVGTSAHIMLDRMGNPIKPWGYFLAYRAKHRFSKRKFFPKELYERMR